MSKYENIVYNGEVISSKLPFLGTNRSFRYGDGLFETIRIIEGKPFGLQNHIDRLFSGAKILSFELPSHFSLEFFKSEIGKLISVNSIAKGAKVRLHLFRSGEGTYRSITDSVAFVLSAETLDTNHFELNQEGITVGIYSDMKKEQNILSNLKTSNSLLYVMAMNYAKKNAFDDVFILNSKNHIIECSQSNIFIVSNGVLYTPPLSEGCVGGTMRMNLINLALKKNITIYESSLTTQNILSADEVILTNAVRGIQWVGGFRNKRYYNKMAKELLSEIVKDEYASNQKNIKTAPFYNS